VWGARISPEVALDTELLLERCRAGDELAWEALVREYQSRVYAVTRHYLRDPEEARDTAQEVFIRLYQRLDAYDGRDSFKAWLLQVARNASIDRLRRIKARPPAVDLQAAEIELPGGDDPAANAAGHARRRLLYRAIAALSPKNREVLLLKEIQGLKLEEVAGMLGLPLGTVKSRSNRARIELVGLLRRLDPSCGERAS